MKKMKTRTMSAVAITLSVIMFLAIVAGAVCGIGVTKCWFGHKFDEATGKCTRCGAEQEKQPDKDNQDNLAIDIHEQGIDLKVVRTRKLYAPDGRAVDDVNVKEMVAIPTPADVPMELTWTLSWKDAASTWASGKTVTDYVTIVVTSDDTLNADLTCLKPFGEQVILTVRSEQYNVESTATVDYVKKVSTRFTIGAQHSVGTYALALDKEYLSWRDNNEVNTWTFAPVTNVDTNVQDWSTETNGGEYSTLGYFKNTYTAGTIENPVVGNVISLTMSDDMYTALGKSNTGATCLYDYSGANHKFSQGSLFFSEANKQYRGGQVGLFYFASAGVATSQDRLVAVEYNKLVNALKSCSIDILATVKTTLEDGIVISKTYAINIADSSLQLCVESLNLSQGSIHF